MSQFQENFWTQGRKDPSSQDPYSHDWGANKMINTFTGTVIDNKNKIQYNSTDRISLT